MGAHSYSGKGKKKKKTFEPWRGALGEFDPNTNPGADPDVNVWISMME